MPCEVPVGNDVQSIGEVQENLYYAPLAWNTHPIDIAHGPQGFGPFHGAYTPIDFSSAKDAQCLGGIDITYLQGSNAVTYAPPYAVSSLMLDRSLAFVANDGFHATVGQSLTRPVGATINNADTVQTTGVPMTGPPSGLITALRRKLGV